MLYIWKTQHTYRKRKREETNNIEIKWHKSQRVHIYCVSLLVLLCICVCYMAMKSNSHICRHHHLRHHLRHHHHRLSRNNTRNSKQQQSSILYFRYMFDFCRVSSKVLMYEKELDVYWACIWHCQTMWFSLHIRYQINVSIFVNVTWMLIRFSASAAFIPGFVARNWIKFYRKHQRNRDEKIMRFSSRILLETLYHVFPSFFSLLLDISFISIFYSNNNIYSLFSYASSSDGSRCLFPSNKIYTFCIFAENWNGNE